MLPVLTNREAQILKLIVHGFSNKEFSCNLSMSESTVENHIHPIYAKLRVSNSAQAVKHAFQLRIVVSQIDVMENRGIPS
jgi:ATP/maltotriose-dependent transcriptional regulator MalT